MLSQFEIHFLMMYVSSCLAAITETGSLGSGDLIQSQGGAQLILWITHIACVDAEKYGQK